MSKSSASIRTLSDRRLLVAFGAMGLVGVVGLSAPANAREIWCAPDDKAYDVNAGKAYETLAGPSTKIEEKSSEKLEGRDVSWRGNIQECPPSAADPGCNFRVDHAESVSHTKSKNFSVGLGATGGAKPIPFPVGGFNYTESTTKTSAFDVANTVNAAPGTRYQPVLYTEFTRYHGVYVGQYRRQGETSTCANAYVLEPNTRFGDPSIDVASDAISGWDKL